MIQGELSRIITAIADDMVATMGRILESVNLGDSRLRKEMYTTIQDDGDNVMISLFMNHYVEWVENGRKPTNNPPLSRWKDPVGDITDWCKRKGIPSDNDTVWRIITKIHRYGYEGKFFMERFFKEAEDNASATIEEIVDEILKDISEWFNG